MGKKRSIDGEADSELIESIDRLRQEVEVLRIVVDELREELQDLVRKSHRETARQHAVDNFKRAGDSSVGAIGLDA